MGGLCAEEKKCSRDPSWLQIAGSMYHMDFNVVKRLLAPVGNRRTVDKVGPVPYSGRKSSEKGPCG